MKKDRITSVSPEAKRHIRAYIAERIDLTDYPELPPADDIHKVYLIFQEESKGIDTRLSSEKRVFIEWMKGLPSVFCPEFYYHDQRKRLREWLNESAKEAEERDDADTALLFYWLICREFFAMLKAASTKPPRKLKSKNIHRLTSSLTVLVWDAGKQHLDRYTAVFYGPGFSFRNRAGRLLHHALSLSEGGVSFSEWIEIEVSAARLGRRIPWNALSSDTQAHITQRAKER